MANLEHEVIVLTVSVEPSRAGAFIALLHTVLRILGNKKYNIVSFKCGKRE